MNIALWVLLLLGQDNVLLAGLGHNCFAVRELSESCLVAKYVGLGWLGSSLGLVQRLHPDPEIRWRLARALRRINDYWHKDVTTSGTDPEKQ